MGMNVAVGTWFDLPLLFPRGPNGSPEARKKLVLAAAAKLGNDVRAKFYLPIAETFVVEWTTPYEGKASIFALPAKKGVPS